MLKLGFNHIDPRYGKPFLGRGRAYLKLGNPTQAIIDAETVIQLTEENFLDPTDWVSRQGWENQRPAVVAQLSDALMLLGDAYQELGKSNLAAQQFKNASNLK